jgi:hypothetical protein
MTRFRMVLIVVGSALMFTFVGPFLYRAVGLDSPVGNCSPVGNSSPVGDNSPVSHRDHHFHRGHRDHVGDSSPVANCSPVGGNSPVGTQTRTRVANALSGGGASGPVITVASGTAVSDQATLSGTNISGAGGTVTYNIDSLNPSEWGWTKVATGGTVTVTGGVVPRSDAVTLDPGVYAWSASYSGDTLHAPSRSERESGIEIVLRPGSTCPTGVGWLSVRCFQDSHHDNHGGNYSGNGGQNDNHGNSGGSAGGNGGRNDNHGNSGGNAGKSSDGSGGRNIHYRNCGGGWSGH